jgi:hypothetical protein
MQIVGSIVPIATIVLIAFLIIRSRFTARPLFGGGSIRSWSLPRPRPRSPKPPQRKPGKLIPFDRAKMDEELARILREKR